MSPMQSAESDKSIRVIGAGLGRTGTKSLQAALDLLGFRTYHFPLPAHSAAWAACAEGTGSVAAAIQTAVDAGYDATCDQPMADTYAEQMDMFKNAKVVLTVRDSPAKWAVSWRVLADFIQVQERPFSFWYPSFIQWIPFMRNWKKMRNLLGVHFGLKPGELVRGFRNQPEGWLEKQYEAHNDAVKRHVPKDKLLVFNVKEGWEPLCKFLGKDVPEVPFPNVNESAELKRAIIMMKTVSYGWIPFVAGVACVSLVAIDVIGNRVRK